MATESKKNKNKKNLQTNLKKRKKLVSFFLFMFTVPKHIANKMVGEAIVSCKRSLSALIDVNSKLIKKTRKKTKKRNKMVGTNSSK